MSDPQTAPKAEAEATPPTATAASAEKPIGFFTFFRTAVFSVKLEVAAAFVAGIAIVSSSLIAVVYIVHVQGMFEPKLTKPAPAATLEVSPTSLVYELKNLSFSTMDKKRIRSAYVQFSLTLQCGDERCMRQMELYRAKLIDLVYEVSSAFYVEDFNTPKGAQDFKKLLAKSYNEFFGESAPKEITIKEWVLN